MPKMLVSLKKTNLWLWRWRFFRFHLPDWCKHSSNSLGGFLSHCWSWRMIPFSRRSWKCELLLPSQCGGTRWRWWEECLSEQNKPESCPAPQTRPPCWAVCSTLVLTQALCRKYMLDQVNINLLECAVVITASNTPIIVAERSSCPVSVTDVLCGLFLAWQRNLSTSDLLLTAEVLKMACSPGWLTSMDSTTLFGLNRVYVMGRVPLSLWQSSWKGFPNTSVPPTTLSTGLETGTGDGPINQLVSAREQDKVKQDCLQPR